MESTALLCLQMTSLRPPVLVSPKPSTLTHVHLWGQHHLSQLFKDDWCHVFLTFAQLLSTHCDASHTRARFLLQLFYKTSLHSSLQFSSEICWQHSALLTPFLFSLYFQAYTLFNFLEFQGDKEINVNKILPSLSTVSLCMRFCSSSFHPFFLY